MNRRLKVASVAFVVGAFMFWTPSNAFAEVVFTEITCQDDQGNQQTFQVGWDNSNSFFEGRGEIPRLYCEGGFAGPYTIYVGDTLAIDSPLRYYMGIVPSPTPSIVTPEPTPIPSMEASPIPSQILESPTPEPTIEPTPTPEPTIEPTPTPEPTIQPTPSQEEVQNIQPTPEPTSAPTSEPSQPGPEPSIESIVETPTPTPSEIVEGPETMLEDQTVELVIPEALAFIPGAEAILAAAEALMNVGSDMTTQERETSQSIAISAILVGQIASSIRKIK